MDTEPDGFTLQDLADRSNVEPRTIRSWIQQNVLPGPVNFGRNARYPAETLNLLLAVKALRDLYGMPMQAIRQELLVATADKIADYAAQATNLAKAPVTQGGPRSAATSLPEVSDDVAKPDTHDPITARLDFKPAPLGTTAASYLRTLRASGVFGAGAPKQPAADGTEARTKELKRQAAAAFARLEANSTAPFDTTPGAKRSRLAMVVSRLESLLGNRSTPRKARGEVRLRIAVTADIELSVRGQMTPEDIANFERIADLLREILNGGPSNV